MVRYSFLLIFLIGFFAISNVKADVCDIEWWKTATVPDLEALDANEDAFPESCGWTTPLHLAAQFGQSKEVVDALLNRTRVDVNAFNAYEQTPLHIAEERQDVAHALAEFAGRTFRDAVRTANRGRASRATTNSTQRDLNDAELAARASNRQAQNEKEVAEAIYETLSFWQ